MADLQALTRSDFTGGFTDDLFDQDPRVCFYNDNLLIDDDDKLVTRWGSQLLSASPQPGGNVRVGRFMVLDHGGPGSPSTYAYAVIGRSIYYGSVSDSTGVTTSLSALKADFIAQSSGTTPINVPWSSWDGVLYFGGGGNKKPFKYIPGISSSGPVTAGLPDVPDTGNTDVYANDAAKITAAATLAVAIRDAMDTHFADTGQHTAADTVADALLPAGTPNSLATLITFVTSLLNAYKSHFDDFRLTSQYHKKETDFPTIPQVSLAHQTLITIEAPTTVAECVDRLHDLKVSYNSHFANMDIHTNTSGGSAAVTSAFLTGITSGPTISQNLQALYDFANRLKTKFNAHLAATTATGAHSTAADGVNTIAAANATTLDTLGTLIYALRGSYKQHDDDAELSAAWAYHVAQEASDHSLDRNAPSTSPPNADAYYGLYGGYKTVPEMVEALNELKTKYNGHVEDWTTHYTNNPAVAETNTLSGPDLVLGNYVYAFCYKRSWSHNAYKTSIDTGPVLLKAATNVVAPEYGSISLTNLPVFANTTSVSDWIADTTLVLQIYRTSSGGTDFFLVGEVTNGTTTFTDRVTDEDLITREALYTNGGEADNTSPPVCSALHICNGFGYYGNITEVNQTTGAIVEYLPNRLYQSKKDDPDAVPGDFYEDLESDLIGISSVRSVPVVFCQRQILRLDGFIDDLGRGGMNPVVIAAKMGCVSEASIVQIEGGIIFAGTDGFAFTDGYTIKPLSAKWKGTYQSLIDSETKRARLVATYDQDNQLVFFGVTRNSASTDNDSWLCLDLSYGLDQPCWLSASNGSIFSTTALAFTSQGKMLRGDKNGYIYYHRESYTTDPYVQTAQTPSTWGTAAIIPDYQTCQIDFGDRSVKKWVPMMSLVNKQLTGLNLAIQVNNDDGKHVGALTAIDRDAVAYTAPTDIAFGTPSNPVSYDGTFEEKRHFPAGTLRCNSKALRFTAAFVQLRDSITDADGTATISGGTTVTLDNGAKSWPATCVGQYLSLAGDSYTARYRIAYRNSATVITLASAASNGSTAWRISGHVKDQLWKMLSYTMRYKMHNYAQSSAGDET